MKSVSVVCLFRKQSVFFLVAFLFLASCKKNNDPLPAERPDIVFYALSTNNQLLRYNAKTVESATSTLSINGLQAGETIISIDFRPATGQLYGLSNNSRFYMINIDNGNAYPVGAAAFSPSLAGTVVSIDFNPTVDRIRLIGNNGQNLRLNPETGSVAATDGTINGGSNPMISGIAYTNSKAGASSTVLYDIDASTRKLYRQDPPNNGTLMEVGSLNVNFTGQSGFDINSDNSVALASLNTGVKSQLHTIDLNTGAATYLGDFSTAIMDIAIPTPAVAYAVDASNNLLIFDPASPATKVSKAITGLNAGENVVGIDFRPVNAQLYALAVGNSGNARLLSLNTSSAASAAIGTGFTLNPASTSFGFDFNPSVDRIRLVSNSGQNLRLNPNDGSIAATDAALNPGTPAVSAAAYTNNLPAASSTSLFVLDASKLYMQNPPNNGTLVEVGSLQVSADQANGFDIGGRSNQAFALLTVSGATRLYTINLATGAAGNPLDFGVNVRGLAIGPGF